MEQGRHDECMRRQGTYAHLVRLQLGGEDEVRADAEPTPLRLPLFGHDGGDGMNRTGATC